jgi:hypothetical protein
MQRPSDFQGNEIYNAPVESVINKTVIPKMHPVIDTSNKINNKNMMFTIENLAYILNDKGYLGDGQGTKVPQSEVGQNRGRLMWFAPYDVEISETAIARYETTNFIGRSEPVYSYQNSERTARLSFKLIIDYPPHVDNMTHGDASKFFAFGGQLTTNELKNIDVDKETAKLKDLENQLASIQPEEDLLPPEDLQSGVKGVFFFHNDGYDVEEDLSIGYENGETGITETTDFGYNKWFTDDVNILVTEILNKETYQFYSLQFVGRASRLYFNQKLEAGYNKELGLKRAENLMKYVEKQFRANNGGLTFEKAGISVSMSTTGSGWRIG